MGIPQVISIAVLLGAVGSLHCMGMCGPLAFALPVSHRSVAGRLAGGTLYNLGRISTYTVLGLLFGLAGQSILSPRWQSTISVVLGALIFRIPLLPEKMVGCTGKPGYAAAFFATPVSHRPLFRSHRYSSLYSIGILNGLLPCGMVYLALTSSLVTGSALKGGVFMAFFGIGTFPAMLAAVFFGSLMGQEVRLRLRRAVPVFLFLMATLLVLRGMNLGIPYLSPSLPAGTAQETVSCH